MCILDVIFNTLLIPHFGVMGAGMGTALACAVISLTMAWRCYFCNPALSLNRKEKGSFERNILQKALKIGTPVAVQEIAMSGAQVASTMIIAPLGAVAIAAHSFAITAESFCYMPGYGIGSAATTLVGRSIGAKKDTLARRYGVICTVMGAVFMGLTGLFMMFLCPYARVLRIGLLAEPLYGISIVAAGALRGTGDTFVPSLMNLGSIWIVRIGLATLLVGPLGLQGVWIAMATELCVRGLLMLYRHKTTPYYKKTPTAGPL